MKKKLYVVYKNGYIEDYCLVYGSTELEIISIYCKEFNKEIITLDEFYETHTIEEINMIGDKKIKEILFYDESEE